MRRKYPFPFLLVLILLFAGLAPRRALAARPPKPAYAAVLETLGGAAAGVFLGYLGGRIGAAQGTCDEKGGDPFGGCGDKVGLAFLGAALGFTIGNPLGIAVTGSALSQHGSTAGAAILGVFGEVAAISLLYRADPGPAWGLTTLALLPAAAGTAGYHWFADPREESDTTLRLRAARAAEAVARARVAVPGLPGDRFRADLLTYRF
jgi:hypothetical protein